MLWVEQPYNLLGWEQLPGDSEEVKLSKKKDFLGKELKGCTLNVTSY